MQQSRSFVFACLLTLGAHALNLKQGGTSLSNSNANGLFSQVRSQQSTQRTHTCRATHDRNKAKLVDFYAQTTLFTDVDFPTDDALYWADYASESLS